MASNGSRERSDTRPSYAATRAAATIGRVSLLLLVDLDGVVYRGSDPIPGVAAVLADRAARGDAVVYVTNNSMHYRADYVTRLRAMGAPITPDTVVSSARATALHLAHHEPGVRRVLVLGASGLERELRDVGLDVVTAAHAATRMHQEGIDGWSAAGAPDAVVTGLDPNLTYLRLAAAADCVRAGARSIATNRDPTYPTERGLRPGRGQHRRRPGGHDRGHADGHRQALAAPARARGRGRRAAGGRGGDDRRRHPFRPGRGPGRRCPLRVHADRGHDPGTAGRPAARRAADRRGHRRHRAGGHPRGPRASPACASGASSGMPAAQASNSARSGSRVASSANATSRA